MMQFDNSNEQYFLINNLLLLKDYPSLGHINHVAKEHSVNVIWAVTESHLDLYQVKRKILFFNCKIYDFSHLEINTPINCIGSGGNIS